MTDYIATGAVVPQVIADIVRGIADGCVATGTALMGGETAEHPGLMKPGEYDVAGAAVGVVEADALLGAHRVAPGDAVLGIDSSGLHSNGYSLVRAVVAAAGWDLGREVPEFSRTLGEELLEPTALYTRACLGLVESLGPAVHAFAHVTGGGLAANLARVLPECCAATVRRDAWEVPAVFQVLREVGALGWADLERTWNLGIGMVAVVAPGSIDAAIADLVRSGFRARPIGEVYQPDSAALGLDRASFEDVVSGAKGVAGGRVVSSGTYR
jgi:phosphoribosylformylglycinamidine cyclo-ligase